MQIQEQRRNTKRRTNKFTVSKHRQLKEGQACQLKTQGTNELMAQGWKKTGSKKNRGHKWNHEDDELLKQSTLRADLWIVTHIQRLATSHRTARQNNAATFPHWADPLFMCGRVGGWGSDGQHDKFSVRTPNWLDLTWTHTGWGRGELFWRKGSVTFKIAKCCWILPTN